MVLIGEGSYGKVYSPPFSCKKKYDMVNKVGKVFETRDDYQKEVRIARKIRDLNSTNIFSIPFYETCPENLQILYKNGGLDLYEYMKKYSPTRHFNIIINQMKNMCHGIKLLIKNNYVHQDIKLENIVFDGVKLYMIDFGLMSHIDDVYQKPYFLNYDYLAFPPEYKRNTNKALTFYEFEELFLKNFQSQRFLSFIKTKIYHTFHDDLRDLYKNPSYPTNKIDIYSLGMVMASVYYWYYNKHKKEHLQLATLISGMICMNPKKRWDIDRIIAYFQVLI